MELTLNIYEKGNKNKIEKTYKTNTIDFSMGIIDDLAGALNFDAVKTGGNLEIASIVVKCSKVINPFLMDMFDGVTEEEIRRTKLSNVVEIFKGIYNYITHEIAEATGEVKN